MNLIETCSSVTAFSRKGDKTFSVIRIRSGSNAEVFSRVHASEDEGYVLNRYVGIVSLESNLKLLSVLESDARIGNISIGDLQLAGRRVGIVRGCLGEGHGAESRNADDKVRIELDSDGVSREVKREGAGGSDESDRSGSNSIYSFHVFCQGEVVAGGVISPADKYRNRLKLRSCQLYFMKKTIN